MSQPATIKGNILAPYKFTESETLELARKLAQSTQRTTALKDQQKTVVSDFKSQLDREAGESNSLSIKIAQGYEMRDTEVVIEFHPKEKVKRIYNAETGIFIKEESMRPEDFQAEMKLASPNHEIGVLR